MPPDRPMPHQYTFKVIKADQRGRPHDYWMMGGFADLSEASAIGISASQECGGTIDLYIREGFDFACGSPLDPRFRLFGTYNPPPPDGTRGIFVSNPITIQPRPIIHSPELDPQELRSWLLFWDEIGIPTNNVAPRELSATEEYLRSVGVLKRWSCNWACEPNDDELLRDSFLFAFRRVDTREPGKWSAAVGGRSINFEMSLDKGHRSTLVSLYRALPVPQEETPLEDLLEFKSRRAGELTALRSHLEEVYARVQAAGDGELALRGEVERLQRGIEDLAKSMRSEPFNFIRASLSAKLNFPAATAVAAGTQLVHWPLTTSFLAAAAAGFAIEVGVGVKERSGGPTPLSYLAKYHCDLRG